MEKYYKAYLHAEEDSDGVVHLTDNEYKAVQKFLDQVYSFSEGWCGTCGIEEKPFHTVEEAQESWQKEKYGEEDD